MASGFDNSTGKYGSSDTTDILSIPVVGIYNSGLWVFKLTVPYVRVSGVGGRQASQVNDDREYQEHDPFWIV